MDDRNWDSSLVLQVIDFMMVLRRFSLAAEHREKVRREGVLAFLDKIIT